MKCASINLALLVFAFCVNAFAAFTIGYGIGRDVGAEKLYESINAALAERAND